MSDSWKRFLLQWVLPVAVFGVVLVFFFASFTANIKQEAITSYEDELRLATQKYASDISSEVAKVYDVSSVAASFLSESDGTEDSKSQVLSAIVDHSDAYLAIIADETGKGVSHEGKEINIASSEYFKNAFSSDSKKQYFVFDDGVVGNPAMVIANGIATEDGSSQKLLVYCPLNVSMLKKLVNVEKEYDSGSYSLIVDGDGNIYGSTHTNDKYISGSNLWTELEKSNNSASVRRMKTKYEDGNSGSFNASMGNFSYMMAYSPISGTDRYLIIQYNTVTLERAESKMYSQTIKKLSWFIVLILVFIVLITVLNIVQIFVSNKNAEDLKDKADTDQLTGLKNKLATEREIKEYIADNPDALAMMFLIDIDNFKKINDTMGHAFGDEVLRELGRHIGINFRVSDVIGRTGGDEFTVFLKNLKEDANTLREAQKLIYFFKHFQVGDYVKYTVTASIGAAVFPAHGADFETLYKAADAAVYKSKKRGKNQLSFYDDRDRTPEEVAEADAHLIDIERKEETPIES